MMSPNRRGPTIVYPNVKEKYTLKPPKRGAFNIQTYKHANYLETIILEVLETIQMTREHFKKDVKCLRNHYIPLLKKTRVVITPCSAPLCKIYNYN